MESGKSALAAKLIKPGQDTDGRPNGWPKKHEVDGYRHGASGKINAGLASGMGGGA
jgi:hypothetical protein